MQQTAGIIKALVLSVFLFAALLIYVGISVGLEPIEEGNIMSLLIGPSVTAIAILFSMMLVVFSQLAKHTSPVSLKNIARDQSFSYTSIYAVACILYNAIFLLLGQSNAYITSFSIFMLLGLLLILGLSVKHAMWLFDPKNSILDPTEKLVAKKIASHISQSWQQHTKSGRSARIYWFKPSAQIVKLIEAELLPVRDMALRSTKQLRLEEASNAIHSIKAAIVNYLKQRKEFFSDDDEVMIFIYGELRLLLKVSSNELKVNLHLEIAKTWEEIGTQAAQVQIHKLGRTTSFNNLATFPVKALEEICIINLEEDHSYASYQAVRALASISRKLIYERYDQQAAEITESLAKLAIKADKVSYQYAVSQTANRAMLDILCLGLAKRNICRKDYHNSTFKGILRSILISLQDRLEQERNTSKDSVILPLIGKLYDPISHTNLSRAIDYAFYQKGLNAYSLEYNIKTADSIYRSVYMPAYSLVGVKHNNLQDDLIDTVYRSQLLLLSTFSSRIRSNIVLNKAGELKLSEKDLATIKSMFIDLNSHILETFVHGKHYQYVNDLSLDLVFSLFFIMLLVEDELEGFQLGEDMYNLIKNTLTQYTKDSESGNETLFRYCRLANIYLKRADRVSKYQEFEIPAYTHTSSDSYGLGSSPELPQAFMSIGNQWYTLRTFALQRQKKRDIFQEVDVLINPY